MSTRLVIDKAGRVVIPKPLRESLRLEPGDSLEMESVGEKITLRPVRGTGPLIKEQGVWVFHAGPLLPASATDEILDQIRDERDLANLGKANEGVSGYLCSCAALLRRSHSPLGKPESIHPLQYESRLLRGAQPR